MKKISAYAPAIIGDGFLVISAVIDYNDIYIPVVEGFTKLALVFVGIMAAILLMALYMAKLSTLDKGKQHKQQENGLSTLPKVPPGKEKGGIFA